MNGLHTKTGKDRKTNSVRPRYSVEFFHIYSDEHIDVNHSASIEYVDLIRRAWPHNLDLTIMIDNYNAESIVTGHDEIIQFLDSNGVRPSFWAYEADLIPNADNLIRKITIPRLRKQYRRYVESRNRYPCSLLAAAWYLTRLGCLDFRNVIRGADNSFVAEYLPADRLINILPDTYKPVEQRIINLIRGSEFSGHIDNIQDLFYTAVEGKIRELS